jgi:PAS domain S-box-containing protein
MPEEIVVSKGSERTFRDFLESAPDAMVIVDNAGRVVMVNRQTEKLFGYRREELIHQLVDMLVPDRLRTRHVAHRNGFFSEPRTRPMGMGLELFGRRKDGSEFPVEISLSPISTEQGTLVSSAIRDITERKSFEQTLQEKNLELETANMAKDRFLTGMSHELRTPLNAIIGFTGTLLMKLPGPLTAEQERQLGIVQSSARHLLSLINEVLDIAKIESGKVEVRLEPVVVEDVVNEAVTSLRSIAEQKGLALRFAGNSEKIVLKTDRRALHQITINLVNNAIKYTADGSVRIELARSQHNGPSVDLRVIDTGVGIKPEDQLRIFQRFEQLDHTAARHEEGAGLGLYICQRLAELLGGRLEVESEFGKGSTFTLQLPDNS